VLNLVANAHDAIALDGHVQIETAVEIAADASSPGPWRSDPAIGQVVRLSVSDDGRGMAADIVEHIFEPFFTTKDSGTGLGLASVYGIVAQSGGHIACDTVEGAGTTFHVRLPVRRQP
jgi:two-component system cell cycle sensor histidine kinase/response regulator CckA